jgi:hypothetical protein
MITLDNHAQQQPMLREVFFDSNGVVGTLRQLTPFSHPSGLVSTKLLTAEMAEVTWSLHWCRGGRG